MAEENTAADTPLNGETNCIECSQPTSEGRCINADCAIAQRQHSLYASRSTAKAGAAAVDPAERPRAFSSSGRVD